MSFAARRPCTILGVRYAPGDVVPDEVFESLPRGSALVRAGIVDYKGSKDLDPNSVRSSRAKRAAATAEPAPKVKGGHPVVVLDEVKPPAKKAPAKKTVAKKVPA